MTWLTGKNRPDPRVYEPDPNWEENQTDEIIGVLIELGWFASFDRGNGFRYKIEHKKISIQQPKLPDNKNNQHPIPDRVFALLEGRIAELKKREQTTADQYSFKSLKIQPGSAFHLAIEGSRNSKYPA